MILSESNHKPTLVSSEGTFCASFESTSFTHIVIITIFHLHGLNTIIEHLRNKKLRFFLQFTNSELWYSHWKKIDYFLIRYMYHFYNLRSAFSLFSVFDSLWKTIIFVITRLKFNNLSWQSVYINDTLQIMSQSSNCWWK